MTLHYSVLKSRFSIPRRDLSAGCSDEKGPVSTNFRPNIVPNCGEDLFFVFTRFRGRNYIIATKLLWHFECIWSRRQKRPPCLILQFKYRLRSIFSTFSPYPMGCGPIIGSSRRSSELSFLGRGRAVAPPKSSIFLIVFVF